MELCSEAQICVQMLRDLGWVMTSEGDESLYFHKMDNDLDISVCVYKGRGQSYVEVECQDQPPTDDDWFVMETEPKLPIPLHLWAILNQNAYQLFKSLQRLRRWEIEHRPTKRIGSEVPISY